MNKRHWDAVKHADCEVPESKELLESGVDKPEVHAAWLSAFTRFYYADKLELIEKVKALRSEGYNYSEIATQVGCSTTTAMNLAKK